MTRLLESSLQLDPQAFKQCFLNCIESISKAIGAQVIPIDGKTVRQSFALSSGQSAIHVVRAWTSSHRLVLGQLKVEEKSNEITAIPKLLDVLEITGCIITIDAIGCQKEIAAKIIGENADYVLALKGNQANLYKQVRSWFELARRLIEQAWTDVRIDYKTLIAELITIQ